MRKVSIALILITVALVMVGCKKHDVKSDARKEIQQIVKDVYAPKSMEQFRESYNNSISSNLMSREAADSFYIIHGDKLTSDDLKRSCYVDVMYSRREDNSESKSHYLAKLNLHGAYGEKVTADIFFYLDEKNIINRILVTNIETGD